MNKEYIKGFLSYLIVGFISLILYFLIATLLNQFLSPEIRRNAWQSLEFTSLVSFFAYLLGPVLLNFGLYGMLRVDTDLPKSKKILSSARNNKIVSFLFFLTTFLNAIVNFPLYFFSLAYGLGYLSTPNEAGGNGILFGFITLIFFFQTVSGLFLLFYFLIRKEHIKDKSAYYLFGILVNIIALLISVFVYYPYLAINFH